MPQININISKKCFNDAYLPDLFDYSCRYQIFIGSAGSGKSHYVFQKMVIKALNQKRKVLVLRQVARTIKDSVFQMTLDTLARFKVLEMCSVNHSTFTITLPNGSTFLFKGLMDEGEEKLKSIVDITDVVIEEATEITEDAFTQVDLRLRAKVPNQQIYLMLNPVSKLNWCYRHWVENGTPENTKLIHTTYRDNRFLPQEYIDSIEALEHTNYYYWLVYGLGEWATLGKLVYTNWKAVEGLVVPAGLPTLVGLDFGFSQDPTALVVSSIDETNKVLYVWDEYYKSGMLNDEIFNIIAYKGLTKATIIADSAEQKSIEEIKRCGVPRIKPAAKGAGSIMQGIQKLQQYTIYVDSARCPNTVVELQNYEYKKDKKSGLYVNEPIDKYNHALDALRYSLQCLDNNQRLKTINKAALGL